MHCGSYVSASEQFIYKKKNIHPFSYLHPRHCCVRTKSVHREQFYVVQIVLNYGIRAAPMIAQEKFTAIYDVILLDEKFLQFDWLRGVVFHLHLV